MCLIYVNDLSNIFSEADSCVKLRAYTCSTSEISLILFNRNCHCRVHKSVLVSLYRVVRIMRTGRILFLLLSFWYPAVTKQVFKPITLLQIFLIRHCIFKHACNTFLTSDQIYFYHPNTFTWRRVKFVKLLTDSIVLCCTYTQMLVEWA
jgi:hypothetical protein